MRSALYNNNYYHDENNFTHDISINVVRILIINPIIVIKFGASQIGTFDTSQHHHGCNIGSNKLTLVQAYLCSDNLFNCTGDNSFCLYKIMFLKFTIIILKRA